MTLALLWTASALSAVTLPSAVVQTWEGWGPLLRRRRRRIGRPPVPHPARAPWVSVHVPCHAEPPQIVIGTLERLARLAYPNFEVLVIDNMPAELWLAATCLLAGSLCMRWLTCRLVVGATTQQALGGILAFAALTHVITTASLQGLVRRPARWQRTSKFRQPLRGLRALTQASNETTLGLVGVLAAAVLIALHSGGLAAALVIGMAVQAATYLSAPLVAIAADRSLARAAAQASPPATPAAIGFYRPDAVLPTAYRSRRETAQWPPRPHDQRRPPIGSHHAGPSHPRPRTQQLAPLPPARPTVHGPSRVGRRRISRDDQPTSGVIGHQHHAYQSPDEHPWSNTWPK